jgi:hypothetical protein
MINNNMTVNEAVAVVEDFIKHYIAFEQRTNDKYELQRVLPKITNETAKAAIQKEIDSISNEEELICTNHQLLIQQFAEYVFHNDFRKNLLVIETYFDTQSYRNNSGGYDDFFYYVFTGELGKPLDSLMTLSSYYEFYANDKKVPAEKQLSNKMNYRDFANVVNKYFIAEGEPLK